MRYQLSYPGLDLITKFIENILDSAMDKIEETSEEPKFEEEFQLDRNVTPTFEDETSQGMEVEELSR